MSKDLLVFDLETLRFAEQVEGGWDNIAGMGFGCACLYSYSKDEYLFFMSHQRETCLSMLEDATIVSFNGVRFDNLVVLEDNDPQKVLWKDIDLFSEIVTAKFGVQSVEDAFSKVGKFNVLNGSLNLNAVCEATLGCVKYGKGCKAPEFIANKWWADVFQYNLRDVRLTRKLFEFVRANGFCIDGHGNKIEVKLDVDVRDLKESS